MITASANVQAYEDTPKPGEVLPIHIFSPESREIDGGTVANLAKALKRDGSFIHPIVVREEGTARYRLVAGYHRLQAWERHFGKLQPITALIYTPDTPDARIDVIKIEENLLRNELTAAERTVQEMRWTAAIKKLNGGKPCTAPHLASRG